MWWGSEITSSVLYWNTNKVKESFQIQKVVSSLNAFRCDFVTCEGVEFGCIRLFHCRDLLGAFGSCINNTKSWAASLLSWGSWQGLSLPFPSSTPLSFPCLFLSLSLSGYFLHSHTHIVTHTHTLCTRFGSELSEKKNSLRRSLRTDLWELKCVIIHKPSLETLPVPYFLQAALPNSRWGKEFFKGRKLPLI